MGWTQLCFGQTPNAAHGLALYSQRPNQCVSPTTTQCVGAVTYHNAVLEPYSCGRLGKRRGPLLKPHRRHRLRILDVRIEIIGQSTRAATELGLLVRVRTRSLLRLLCCEYGARQQLRRWVFRRCAVVYAGLCSELRVLCSAIVIGLG